MVGVRKHMVMQVKLLKSDSPLWIVAEVEASMAGSTMPPAPPGAHPDPNFVLQQYPRLEHLTCFFPGLLTLGELKRGGGERTGGRQGKGGDGEREEVRVQGVQWQVCCQDASEAHSQAMQKPSLRRDSFISVVLGVR